MQLNENEIRALRYYEGDVKGEDPFWGDPKAYLTLNSLLYPGLRNEKARTAEGKKLNPAILCHDRYPLLELYEDLFAAVCKGAEDRERTVYRVERYSDYLEQKEAGKTLSFTSTSTAGYLKAYGDRVGIALMKIVIPKGVPALDFSKALSEYAKAEEKEILLPPCAKIRIREVPLREEEETILDAQGNKPLVSALCTLEAPRFSLQECEEELPDPSSGQRVYEALNRGEEPSKEDCKAYLAFKEILQKKLWSSFTKISENK